MYSQFWKELTRGYLLFLYKLDAAWKVSECRGEYTRLAVLHSAPKPCFCKGKRHAMIDRFRPNLIHSFSNMQKGEWDFDKKFAIKKSVCSRYWSTCADDLWIYLSAQHETDLQLSMISLLSFSLLFSFQFAHLHVITLMEIISFSNWDLVCKIRP